MKTIVGRCMYVWKLAQILTAERGINNFVAKALAAKLSGVWIKVADGRTPYQNITDEMEQSFRELRVALRSANIDVWGWHVPKAATLDRAEEEASLVADIASSFDLDGVLMDVESESAFFNGGPSEAEIYAKTLRERLDALDKSLAISSHDIPSNFPQFPFNSFAQYARVNAPQVYYGGSLSVENRLDRSINANAHLDIPFTPVGAGFLGDGGGCSSASACAEKAMAFMNLVHQNGFPGYSFWHWQGAPSKLWEVLMVTAP